ncbi:MAG: hypothetical protein KC501_19545 [Myxococcales bacterium]|nr:hypothetical protein [Myxococcales bacterium]
MTVQTDGGSVDVSQTLLMIIEINNDLAAATGVDLVSAYGAISDSATAAKMVSELGLSGRAYIKTVGEKSYLILKGAPGLRPNLTGTRYLTTNPKVVNMVISPSQVARGAAKMVGIAVIAYASLRVVEYILSDGDARLTTLIGTLSTDIIKFGMSAGAGWLASVAVGAVTTLAAGPLVAAILVGVLAGVALDRLDRSFGITDSLVAALESVVDGLSEMIENRPRPIERLAREVSIWERGIIDSAIRRAMGGY